MHKRLSLLLAAALAAGGSIAAQPQLVVPLAPSSGSRSVCSGVTAAMQKQPTAAEQEAQQFRRSQLKGRQLVRAVKKVNRDLEWHDKLERAQKEAIAWGKPIVWIQALGDLDGFT